MDEKFAARLHQALDGRGQRWLSEKAGLATSSIHDYLRGTMPSADRALLVADALGVNIRWLVAGDGPRVPANEAAEGVVAVPCFSLASGTTREWAQTGEKPEPERTLLIAEEVLVPLGRRRTRRRSLWAVHMPGHTMAEIAEPDELVFCADIDGSLADGWVVLFLTEGGTPVMRRVEVRPDQIVLWGTIPKNDPWLLDERMPLRPVGRVVGVSVRSLHQLAQRYAYKPQVGMFFVDNDEEEESAEAGAERLSGP